MVRATSASYPAGNTSSSTRSPRSRVTVTMDGSRLEVGAGPDGSPCVHGRQARLSHLACYIALWAM
jgi:hypothetical protein